MNTENEEILKCAYHESGHIVLAYRYGYYCEWVEISNSGDGTSKINYLADLKPITGIKNAQSEPSFLDEFLQNITLEKQRNLSIIALSIAFAGSVAENYHFNQVNQGMAEIELSGTDLQEVNNIEFFLDSRFPNQINIQYIVQDVYNYISNPNVQTTVNNLANTILSKTDRKLNRMEIEEILNSNS